jgi:hypothetical protein
MSSAIFMGWPMYSFRPVGLVELVWPIRVVGAIWPPVMP